MLVPLAATITDGSFQQSPYTGYLDRSRRVWEPIQHQPFPLGGRQLCIGYEVRMLPEKSLERGFGDSAFEAPKVAALQQSLHGRARAADIVGHLAYRQRLMLHFFSAIFDTLLVLSKRCMGAAIGVLPTLNRIALMPVPSWLPLPWPLVARESTPKELLDCLRCPLQFIRQRFKGSSHVFRFLGPCNDQSGF